MAGNHDIAVGPGSQVADDSGFDVNSLGHQRYLSFCLVYTIVAGTPMAAKNEHCNPGDYNKHDANKSDDAAPMNVHAFWRQMQRFVRQCFFLFANMIIL